MSDAAERLYAELYDGLGVGWPDELDFYQTLAAEATARDEPVLEVACGTGRIALALAEAGANVTGIDLSAEMIAVAEGKRAGSARVRWAVADMRTFALAERYGLVIVPGHSFQFMLTAAEQLTCLETIRRHLLPDGRLVLHLDHQDLDWLGLLPEEPPSAFEPGRQATHPVTGRRYEQMLAWSYERATQTATVRVLWVERDEQGEEIGRLEQTPIAQHCAFRTEMEHLLARAGFAVEALYGDFGRGPLQQDSEEMIWVARPV